MTRVQQVEAHGHQVFSLKIDFEITLCVDSISTILSIAYTLTKGLPSKVFLEHVLDMGMASPYDILV